VVYNNVESFTSSLAELAPMTDLSKTTVVEKFVDEILDVIKQPPADKSFVEVERFDFDPTTGTGSFRAKAVCRNSPAAVIPFSITTHPEFDFDLTTGSVTNQKWEVETKVGKISLPIGTIKAILEGDLPKILHLIPNGGLVKRDIRSNYDEIHAELIARHGKDNFYLASRQFVRWAGLETAGKWVANFVASGGAATGQVMKDIATETLKELKLVVAWLRKKALATAKDTATAILTGDSPAGLPTGITIDAKWQPIRYESRMLVKGNQVGPAFGANNHLGFVFVWSGAGGSSGSTATINAPGPAKDESPDLPAIESLSWSLGVRGASEATGIRLILVKSGTPADKLGLKINDVIQEVNGVAVGQVGGTDKPLKGEFDKSDDGIVKLKIKQEGLPIKVVTVELDVLDTN
jgi:hypothetical protein